MDIYEVIEKRRSVRSYREDEVDDETLNKILNAGRMAPSAHNSQNYKFIVVKKKGVIKSLSKASSDQRFIAEAPIVIVAVSLETEDEAESNVPTYALDIAIAMDHITLAATEERLGTCWIGGFDQEKIKDILNIPEEYKVMTLTPLGSPYDDPQVKSRKDLKDLVCYEDFS